MTNLQSSECFVVWLFNTSDSHSKPHSKNLLVVVQSSRKNILILTTFQKGKMFIWIVGATIMISLAAGKF